MTRAEIREAFERWRQLDPEPKTELLYQTPFQLLVAVVLSAQSTDAGVNRATRTLFKAAPTPKKMVALGVDGVKSHIATLGLYNAKATNVVALSQLLIEQHDGEVPADRDALEALPGVGRKTANVVMNVVFGEPTMAVDTHIFRVANRTGMAPGKTPLAVELELLKRVPGEFMDHAHHWLILHGRYTCVARTPKCPQCAIRDLCKFKDKTAG
ncbi:MAG: endonuclease III [Proteobacteria bacterium]|nr:endonuclease III [Pseudomonadota bacterium]